MAKVAMPGAGFIGGFYTQYIQAQRSRDTVQVVYSRDKGRGMTFAGIHGISEWTNDMSKAVFCTKPLGRNAEEAKMMLDALEKAGVFHGYMENLVYTPKTLTYISSVKNGAIGSVIWARFRETHPDHIPTGSGTRKFRVVEYSWIWVVTALRLPETISRI